MLYYIRGTRFKQATASYFGISVNKPPVTTATRISVDYYRGTWTT